MKINDIKIHNDVIDWQVLSSKKNIEELVKNTSRYNGYQLTMIIEICLAIFTICIDRIFDDNSKDLTVVWIVISFLSILPLVYFFVKQLIQKIRKIIISSLPGADLPNEKDKIDKFDNDICFYVMTAASYSQKLKMISEEEKTTSDPFFEFYYVETCYYTNKAIYELDLMRGVVKKIIINNPKDTKEYIATNCINYSRIINIVKVLNGILFDLDKYKDFLNDYMDDCIKENEQWRIVLKNFEKVVGYNI